MNIEQTETLGLIQPVVVQEYLRSRGWRLTGDFSARGFVEYQQHGEVAVVPMETQFRDYTRRLRELLELLVATENVAWSSLVNDLTQPLGDVLAVRMDTPPAKAGTLLFEDSLRLRQGARTLLLAAAHSERFAQAWFPRLARGEAVELVNRVQEGQTQRGSFIARFIVPLTPSQSEISLGDEPYGRRVIKLLLRGLEAIRRVRSLGDYDELTRLEKQGVSGNLLAALATMGPSTGGAVEFSVSWARGRELPTDVPESVYFTNEALAGLDDVADKMRSKVSIPGFEIQGYVTQLVREATDLNAPGEVTLVPSENESRQFARVSVQLDQGSYAKAINAHKQGDLVQATGTLKKAGRRWVIENAVFEVITGDPEHSREIIP